MGGELYKALYVERNKLRIPMFGQATGANKNLTTEPIPTTDIWFVERIFVWSNTAGAPLAYVFVRGAGEAGGVDYSDAMDFTSNGKSAISDEQAPIVAFGGEAIRIRWEGVSNGDLVAARLQISVRQVVRIVLPESIDLSNEEDRQLLGAFTS